MPYINLIQEERLIAKQLEKRTRLFQGTFAGSLALTMGIFGLFMVRAESLSGEEAALKEQSRKAQPLLEQIAANKRDLQELEPRLQTLEDARTMTGKWGTVLDYITTQTPNQTWLTALRASVTDLTKPVSVAFAGLSDRQELVGEYILRLQSCKDLENVQLRFTAEKPVANARAIEFEVNADLAGTAQKKALKEDSKEEE